MEGKGIEGKISKFVSLNFFEMNHFTFFKNGIKKKRSFFEMAKGGFFNFKIVEAKDLMGRQGG